MEYVCRSNIFERNSLNTRKILGLAAATFLAISLAACSGPAEETDTAEAETTETETVEAADGQTVTEACVAMASPIANASTEIANAAQAASDPQSAVDAWTALADGFASAATEVQNLDVQAAVSAAQTDIAAMRDEIKKVFVDGDMGAMTSYMDASTKMQESYTALMKLCS